MLGQVETRMKAKKTEWEQMILWTKKQQFENCDWQMKGNCSAITKRHLKKSQMKIILG